MTARSLPFRALGAVLLVLAVLVAGCGGDDDDGTSATQAPPPAQTQPGAADEGAAEPTADGAQLFEQRCGSCHTLAAAETGGGIGPNLDNLQPDEATVLTAIREGPGAMPPNLVEGAEAEAVARFVSENAGR